MKVKESIQFTGSLTMWKKVVGIRYQKAFAADRMSDFLRLNTENMLWDTELLNLQATRTAEISDISFIQLVNTKQVNPEMHRLSTENGRLVSPEKPGELSPYQGRRKFKS